ncbi:kinetochore component CENP-S-domain-containing protein [Cokeromyces recurvatus]|uniref:kinetochore component CENP-S-domain-containing protein n=1 Tax=Cokeromyces recurvatus TaxID=90255 RepID=UPI0022203410|nr:kinetochore component CENP-S-domain-containing protein [Cokeromyces recurvatus]KAI7901818.1 kinetochore component CENP-S-domain-containing protein [Cokeromyces recurvatus]
MEEDNQEQKKQLLFAVWNSVNKITKQEAHALGKEVSENFVTSLAEVVFDQMQTMAIDLEAFAGHSKRSVISMEDVKLCARRNDSLHQLISETAKDITEEINSRRKRK